MKRHGAIASFIGCASLLAISCGGGARTGRAAGTAGTGAAGGAIAAARGGSGGGGGAQPFGGSGAAGLGGTSGGGVGGSSMGGGAGGTIAGVGGAGGIHVGGAGGNAAGGAGASGGAGTGTASVSVTVAVDGARTTSATLPIGGGTVLATGADGTTYELIVPADALLSPTTISLTPVTQVSGIPFGTDGTATLGVQLGPEGLFFYQPATLVVRPPAGSAPAIDQQLFVQWQGTGEKLALAAPDRASGEIRIHVFHFSGVAVVPAKGFNSDIEAAGRRLFGEAEAALHNEFALIMMFERQRQLLGMAAEDAATLLYTFQDYAARFEREVLLPRIASHRISCAAGQLAMTTALSYGREQELLGLPDTGRGLAQAIANEVTLECMQEEYEICRDNHIVTRIMRLRLGIDRQATVLGVTDPNATAYDDLVKACLKFALDLDSTTTTTSQKLTIVQSVQSRSIALELQGSIEEWRNGQNGKLKGMGPVVSTDYKVTTSVSCAPISDVTPMSSALEVGSLSLDTGDPPTDNIRDFKLVYRASPNFSFFKVNDACSNPPVVLPPVMENWFTDAAAVLYYKNPLNQAEGGYVITGWNVNLQSEIGRRSVTYVNLNGDILQTLDLDFRLRHVPSQ